jgi:hypothetical protein
MMGGVLVPMPSWRKTDGAQSLAEVMKSNSNVFVDRLSGKGPRRRLAGFPSIINNEEVICAGSVARTASAIMPSG